jgi:hypothetical protein
MKTGQILFLLLNSIALSFIYITTWSQCTDPFNEIDINDSPHIISRPSRLRLSIDGDDDGEDYGDEEDDMVEEDMQDDNIVLETTATSSEMTVSGDKKYSFEPSFLQWDATPVEIPEDWKFVTPKYCRNDTIKEFVDGVEKYGKIIVHYHLQVRIQSAEFCCWYGYKLIQCILLKPNTFLKHNAGTEFYRAIKAFVPCATRACWQISKHCMVSYDERTEAENLRINYRQSGVQYVSYETMLPPKFPLPFVSEEAREGFFFTTIVRDPFRRFLTHLRRINTKRAPVDGPNGPFWNDVREKHGLYDGDNLNIRWLSGARGTITKEHINIAKCRLQLFDLVILDVFYDYALKKVLCPMNGWKGNGYCKQNVAAEEHKSKKADPFEGVDKSLIGAWVERLRPSFEIYDYAKLLSLKQLKQHGVQDLPAVSEVPLYMETMAKYTGTDLWPQHFNKIPKVNLQNMHLFDPPADFCDEMKNVWMEGNDVVPDVYGIGTIKQQWIPSSPQSGIVTFMDPRIPRMNNQ